MQNIKNNISLIEDAIKKAQEKVEASKHHVTLIAVSKTKSAEQIKEAYSAGIQNFGENYLQEAIVKIQALHALPITWHFIGPIQSNKTKFIAEYFDWVHSVSRVKEAMLLNQARPACAKPINICIQVNLDQEASKSGASLEELDELIPQVVAMPWLSLRGLMVIPKPIDDFDEQVSSFQRLTNLLKSLNQKHGLSMDTLSMGMSHDYEAAIKAGSTMVRIGQAIFGKRT